MLFVIIVITVAIEMLILLIGTAIPNSRLQGTLIRDEEQFKHVTVSFFLWELPSKKLSYSLMQP